jgi:hypothetical protein
MRRRQRCSAIPGSQSRHRNGSPTPMRTPARSRVPACAIDTGGSEAADYRDPERRGQWLFVACQCVRLRDRRIHDLAVLAGAGGQFDDIVIGIAEIDRPNKTVVDRPANLSTLGLGLLQHRVEGLGPDPEGDVQIQRGPGA